MDYSPLREIRNNKNMIQEDVAKFLGVSQETYSKYERKKFEIPIKQLNKLSNEWKFSMDYLDLTKINKYNNVFKEINRKVTGQRLKEFRKHFDMTQVQLAKFLNTTQSTISAYESGKTLILTSFAVQISKKYNVSIDFLCGKKSDMFI